MYFRLILLLLIVSCESKEPIPFVEAGDLKEEYSGGQATIFDLSENAFGHQMPGLTSVQSDKFVIGNSFFRSNWTTAPASASARDGLGPLLNAASCGACHNLDGRGRPPLDPKEGLSSMIIRLSVSGQTGVHGEPIGIPNYGDQLSNKAIQNVHPEGDVQVIYNFIEGGYSDGSSFQLANPTYSFINLQYGPLASGALFSPRIAQQIPGLGLIETIDEKSILANADPEDLNNDGISGRPNYVWDVEKKQTVLGRFGWKANQPSIRQQVAAAFIGDIGITSRIFTQENLKGAQVTQYGNLVTGGKPEIADDLLDEVIFYTTTLAVPGRREWKSPDVLSGKKIFENLKCQLCHTQKFTTSSNSTISSLSNQVIRPYTDLLLHDMGSELADGRPDFKATGSEWRTPPLWGIGMIETVNKKSFYLHDGRARTLEEAILWHGGEGENSRSAFKQLAKTERDQLIKFLKSL